MKNVKRRDFLKAGGFSVFGLGVSGYLKGNSDVFSKKEPELLRKKSAVKFTRDGIDMSPLEYSELLFKLSSGNKIVADNYSRNGSVEELEKKFAELTGKESGVFMPTGTLANHIAVRKLSGGKKRVIVPAESHIYNDSGDCAQDLSRLNLIPLGQGKPTFTLSEVKDVFEKTEKGRVKTGIGSILIESPVRRMENRIFDLGEMERISRFAGEKGIGLHLDGARLFNIAAHFDISIKKISSLFDTVYISLYKDFNAASGAVLLGPSSFTKDLFHTRRMFGGGMPQVWPFSSVALHYADSFQEEYKRAVHVFVKLKSILSESGIFNVVTFKGGTNVFFLEVLKKDIDLLIFREKLLKENIEILKPDLKKNGFFMKINVTLNRRSVDSIAKSFMGAAKT